MIEMIIFIDLELPYLDVKVKKSISSLSQQSQIQPNQTNNHRLVQLAKISELSPLISIPALSEHLSSLFRSFLCEPQQYLVKYHPNYLSTFSSLMDILCNEVMACAILGIGDGVYETIVTNFRSFWKATIRKQFEHSWMDNDFGLLQQILKISQDNYAPMKKITEYVNILAGWILTDDNPDENPRMNLLSQCLQHTATYLDAHPDLIDSFLGTIYLSSLSNILFCHDRHFNLISTLSQSSSPLFTKLSEPLLDPTFPLHSLLSPRSFTDPASSFFRMASTNPVFFRRLIETHARPILEITVATAMSSVRVVSDDPSEPHCLEFGRATQNWIVLLNIFEEARKNPISHESKFHPLPSPPLTLLILFAASTNDDLSTAAGSVFSNKFGLSTPHTEALLFATPTTFTLSDAFTPRHSQILGDSTHKNGSSLSICAEAGCCVMTKVLSDFSCTDKAIDFAIKLRVHFAGCLVNALHSTTALSHSFPFFSPELCGLSQQTSVWNDPNQPSALTALTTLAESQINLVFRVSAWERNMNDADEERRDITFVHLFPFLGGQSQAIFLSSFISIYKSMKHPVHTSFERVVEVLLEIATVNSVNTPIALLTETRKIGELLSCINPETHLLDLNRRYQPSFELSIVEKLKTAQGEERWKLLTQLAVVSRDDRNYSTEVMRVENDAQAFLILSVDTIRSAPRINFRLVSNPEAFDRVIEFAGRLDNLPLVRAALAQIGDTVAKVDFHTLVDQVLNIDRKPELRDLVLNTLNVIATRRREGVEEGCAVGKDEMTSQIVVSCLEVFRFLINFDSFDPSPAIDSLVSLAVTTDVSLLRSLLPLLQMIEERTRNTPTPFSISTVTAPFRGIHQASITRQPLSSIVAFILLSIRLDPHQMFKLRCDARTSSPFSDRYNQPENPISLSNLFSELNESLITEIAKEMTENVCLILEERKASSSCPLTPDDPLGISLAQNDRTTTPKQLIIALHDIVIPDDPASISASTFVPLAPFLSRILKIVVPSSTDRMDISWKDVEPSQWLNVFLSLVLCLFHMTTPSTLSAPPLSSLLSALSIALVRLDTIPSSLSLYSKFRSMFELSQNRSNQQLGQIVLVLSEEGMEDRSELALDSFSLVFLNKLKGTNVQGRVDPPHQHTRRRPFFKLADGGQRQVRRDNRRDFGGFGDEDFIRNEPFHRQHLFQPEHDPSMLRSIWRRFGLSSRPNSRWY
ncbi:hypothetical protein BLNAU_17482 [Blattamonas nauphoetae]|uniref:Mediator of RNA polymerase II transcription subunit 5 n=1 Tax=Blattamonas nauphoetae TaxID=2049346 RepID=A0ABQ9XA59_9EUKA|nr:hypothetical protein BLNAU_17482 [Blattamonas nauphoetae]